MNRKSTLVILTLFLTVSCIQKSFDQKLSDLEKKGTIPTLDRSHDLMGKDSNNDGIRDDIDSIIQAMNISLEAKKEAMQVAKGLQETLLVDLNDETKMREVSNKTALDIVCLSRALDKSREEPSKMISIVSTLEKFNANTKERAMAYLKYNQKQSGTVTRLPDEKECLER